MTVKQILGAKGDLVVTVDPDEVIHIALRKFRMHQIGALVVTDADGHLLGVLSERDLVNGLLASGKRLLDLPVKEVMASAVPTCAPKDSVASVMRTMTNRRTRHLPVIEGGVVAGLISIGDVVKSPARRCGAGEQGPSGHRPSPVVADDQPGPARGERVAIRSRLPIWPVRSSDPRSGPPPPARSSSVDGSE